MFAQVLSASAKSRRDKLYFVATVCGFSIGIAIWCGGSMWIASSLDRAEIHHPELIGTRKLRIAEGVACGALFFACVGLAVGLARLIWLQIK